MAGLCSKTIELTDLCALTSQMGKSLTNPPKFLPVDDLMDISGSVPVTANEHRQTKIQQQHWRLGQQLRWHLRVQGHIRGVFIQSTENSKRYWGLIKS